MNRVKFLLLAACAATTFPSVSRAEPLPPELNLVPRDAAMFVSVRVADLWNQSRLKPLRDFIVEEGRILRDLEKETGFRPEEVERVSVVFPSFHPRSVVTEPMIVVTMSKPYDLAKILDRFDGYSEAQFREMNRARMKRGFPVPSNGPAIAPRAEDAPPPLPKPAVDKEPPAKFSDCNQVVDPLLKQPEDRKIVRDLKAPYYFLGRNDGLLIPINERTLIIAMLNAYRTQSATHDLLAALLKRSDKGPLSSALQAAAEKHAIVLGVNLPAAKDAIPEKSFANALPIDSLMKCQSATATLDFGNEIRLGLQVDATDEATAKRVLDVLRSIHILGMESLPGLMKMVDEDSPGRILLSLAEPVLRDAKFELKGTTANVVMASRADEQLAKTIKDSLEKLKEAAERVRSQNNLKQMVIAVHNYHDAMGQFPFMGIPGPNGRNLKLSWRVAILPYIEEAPLYNQFRLDEAWDSEHNKKLIARMPKIFAPVGGVKAAEGHTFYRVFSGQQGFGSAQSFAQITDGTSNTIMILEAGDSEIWTKPDNFPYDPNKPLPKLGGHYKGKMNVAMGDGSVRTIDLKNVPESVLRAMITTNGGETYDYPDDRRDRFPTPVPAREEFKR